MADTPNLKLPEITQGQSQKEVTHNEALRALDALVQCTVIDKDLSDPPVSPSDGDTYIVGSSTSSSSEWNGHDDEIAYYSSSAWVFSTPREGWTVWVLDENRLYVYRGASDGWTELVFTDLGDTPDTLLGSGNKIVRVNSGQTALEFADNSYDISVFFSGKPGASQVILRFPVVRAVLFSDEFAGSLAESGAAAGTSAGATFSVKKNGTQVGTITFAVGQTSATFETTAGAVTFTAGNILTVVGPASPDPDLEDIGVVFKGTMS